MPSGTTKSDWLKEYGSRFGKGLADHMSKPPELGGFNDPPVGIKGGIAQLTKIEIRKIEPGKSNEGKHYFYAEGIIKSPFEHEGERAAGKRTSIMENMFDTPAASKRKTFEDHRNFILDACRMLDQSLFEDLAEDGSDFEERLQMLVEAAPHFKFRTWKGKDQQIKKQADGKLLVIDEDGMKLGGPYPTEVALKKAFPYAGRDSRVQSSWEGACAWTEGQEDEVKANVGIEDDSEEVGLPPKASTKPNVSTNGITTARTQSSKPNVAGKPSASGKPAPKKPSPEPEPDEESASGFDEFGDLDSLAVKAEKGDKTAIKQLTDLALARDIDIDAVKAADSWADVVEMINGASAEGDTEASEEESPSDEGEEAEEKEGWKVGHACKYHPLDKTTNKPSKKAVECEILEIGEDGKVLLKNLDDGKTKYKNVPLTKLVEV